MVLAVLCMTLAISYALSRTSITTASLSVHESGGLRARSAAETSVTPVLVNLRANPNWMPKRSPTDGGLAFDERYRVSLAISENGSGRTLEAAAQVYDLAQIMAGPNGGQSVTLPETDRPIADQRLRIRLAKQTLNNLPTAAIAAFDTKLGRANDPPVYIASGSTVRGDVKCNGPIHFQQGFQLEGTARLLGNVSRSGTNARRYFTYRASWGSTYQAESLAEHGQSVDQGTLHLQNVLLGPSSANPMGVFYYTGDNLVLEDNVQINGTLVAQGNLTIRGLGIHLIALTQAQIPNNSPPQVPPSEDPTGLVDNLVDFLNSFPLFSEDDMLEHVPSELTGDSPVNTTFPAVVADGDIVLEARADVVRISGLILAGSSFHREAHDSASLLCAHDHLIPLGQMLDLLNSVNGPAVYVRGAIISGRVNLEHCPVRPFAVEYDSAVTNVRDAPGFFTWRVDDWLEANY
jgi:hypothetical protein